MKIERLAGFPGNAKVWTHSINGGHVVAQCSENGPTKGYIIGPTRKDERSAIRAWNAMVRRIRKANAQGLEGTK